MATLRSEEGCPWDREQTRESLKPFLLEETYEVLEAIDAGQADDLKEELGDLLFQILFHSQIAKERDEFGIEDVIGDVTEKMKRRHPHVFGASRKRVKPSTGKEALARWEQIKGNETKNRGRQSILDGVPRQLPALMRAYQLQARAARIGFDWKEIRPVWAKVREEIKELEHAIDKSRRSEIRDELGDLLFSLVNMARFLKLDPEESLRRANRRFADRFQYMERKAGKGRLSKMTLGEMDRLWNEAKRTGEKRSKRRRS